MLKSTKTMAIFGVCTRCSHCFWWALILNHYFEPLWFVSKPFFRIFFALFGYQIKCIPKKNHSKVKILAFHFVAQSQSSYNIFMKISQHKNWWNVRFHWQLHNAQTSAIDINQLIVAQESSQLSEIKTWDLRRRKSIKLCKRFYSIENVR